MKIDGCMFPNFYCFAPVVYEYKTAILFVYDYILDAGICPSTILVLANQVNLLTANSADVSGP